MTAMTLNADRVRRLAKSVDMPSISESQADGVALILGDALVAADALPADEDSAWDCAWKIAERLLSELRRDLVDDIMEIGFVAEQIYPLVELGAEEPAAGQSPCCFVCSGEGVI